MTTRSYDRALYAAKQDLARCLEQRQRIDGEIGRLQAVIANLQNLCAERDRKSLQVRVDRVIKKNLTKGITEEIRVILKEKFFPMTAGELKQTLEARKYDLSRYANSVAVLHTVLKRLVQGGEVKVIPQKRGKKAYQWISTTDRLLSELQESGRTAKESK